ncbi:MAG TPA: deoxyribodipyrimidine photo-lyase [Solirubrobacterales bacterium]|nr:deoxyribodipyrimidine photo-lyase [Solirubrobacterales bacterium]
MSCAVVLFTRDLRVRDQQALSAAAREAEHVVPLFVFDDVLLRGSCGAPNRVSFLLDSLRDLDSSLRERGSRLVLRRGDPVEEAMRVAGESGATTIHLSDDFSAYACRRRARLAVECKRARLRLRIHPGVTVVEPGELVPAGGDHYRVFTPFWRAWVERPRHQPLPAPRKLELSPGIRIGRIPPPRRLGAGAPSRELSEGGETAARQRLERWLRGGIAGYEGSHDDLASPHGTSHLSADLHFGCLSPVTVLARSEGRPGGDAFARQLCWRDFHHQVLAARPDLPHADYRARGDRWRRSKRLAEAWREGRTGYPIVDAGMRQLAREGFMHNRARMIVASFLTKTLYLDWRLGAAHFAGLLVDADVANNVGNWQWVAGTGNDTRPNRVLNPVRQANRFDPDGEYVRRFVPELAAVPGRSVHEPWLLEPKERRALDYPVPVADHEEGAVQFRRFRESEAG